MKNTKAPPDAYEALSQIGLDSEDIVRLRKHCRLTEQSPTEIISDALRMYGYTLATEVCDGLAIAIVRRKNNQAIVFLNRKPGTE